MGAGVVIATSSPGAGGDTAPRGTGKVNRRRGGVRGSQQAAKRPGSGAIRQPGTERRREGGPGPDARSGRRSGPRPRPGGAGPAAHPGRLTFLFGIMSLLRAAEVKRPKEAPAEARDPPGGGGGGDSGVAGARSCARCPPPPAPRQPPPPAPASPTGRAERGGRASPLAPPAAPRPGGSRAREAPPAVGKRTGRGSGRAGQVARGERGAVSAGKPLQGSVPVQVHQLSLFTCTFLLSYAPVPSPRLKSAAVFLHCYCCAFCNPGVCFAV